MAQTYRQELGRWGEQAAAKYLVDQGYTILEQNFRTPYGEIDLIAQRQEFFPGEGALHPVVIFIEVKTRRSGAFGKPEEAITKVKREHLQAAAQSYIQLHPELADCWRIDVIAIRRDQPGDLPEIIHFENALA